MKILKFGAKWCTSCTGLDKVLNESQQLFNAPVESIDIDDQFKLAAQYNIRSVPTMILLNDDGSEIARKVGSVSQSGLVEFLKG